MLNDYNKISGSYQQTDVKPDKQFSTLPTVLALAGNVKNKTVLDLGCGSGFYANALANIGAASVIGIDNSTEQISLAKKNPARNTEYIVGNIFEDVLPQADIVVAPYVANYATDTAKLIAFFQIIFNGLKNDGKLIAVVDFPEGKDLKKFGAVKKVIGNKIDGAKIEIQLFDKNQHICTLNAVYFKKETIEDALRSVGFVEITWHKPIISDEGREKLGDSFWENYVEAPELGYITAKKL